MSRTGVIKNGALVIDCSQYVRSDDSMKTDQSYKNEEAIKLQRHIARDNTLPNCNDKVESISFHLFKRQ